MNIRPVVDVLDRLGVAFVLVGGHAMAARGYPRFTVDVDFLTTDGRVLDPASWTALVGAGAKVDPRRGDADDPLAGVVHIQLRDGTDVDIVVGRWPWEAALVERAEPLDVLGVRVPVPTVSDLILLKLAAGGYADRHDAAALLALGDRPAVIREVEVRIDDVRPDIHELWRALRDQS